MNSVSSTSVISNGRSEIEEQHSKENKRKDPAALCLSRSVRSVYRRLPPSGCMCRFGQVCKDSGQPEDPACRVRSNKYGGVAMQHSGSTGNPCLESRPAAHLRNVTIDEFRIDYRPSPLPTYLPYLLPYLLCPW